MIRKLSSIIGKMCNVYSIFLILCINFNDNIHVFRPKKKYFRKNFIFLYPVSGFHLSEKTTISNYQLIYFYFFNNLALIFCKTIY